MITAIFENTSSLRRLTSLPNEPHGTFKGGLTHAQIGLMCAVSHHGPQSIKQLAERFHISPSAVTQLVDNLVKDNLVERKEDRKDHRKIFIQLTRKGKKELQRIKEQRFEKMAKILEALTDKELGQLQKLQQKIIQHWYLHDQKNDNTK